MTSRQQLLGLYRTMTLIRAFEENAARELSARSIFGAMHSSAGQEAVATGICAHLTPKDYLASTHRGHGHCLAKGVDPKAMMAELFGKAAGTNKGKGGSMHICEMSVGMLGANAIVGASVPLAVGAALKVRLKGERNVAVAMFGDGAANTGVVHESMNLASIWKLPVVFVCENNLYAESTPVEYATSVTNIADRAAAYGMPGVVVGGMDVLAVYKAAGEAIQRAREGGGPSLLEAKTYRFYGHAAVDDPLRYRTKEEQEYWRARDPILLFRQRVLLEGLLREEDLATVDEQVAALVAEAVQFADASAPPNREDLLSDVYVNVPVEALVRGTGLSI